MARQKKRQARAIARIREARTNRIVGYLYEWNTGETGRMWTNEPFEDVTYEFA